jgi:uncharacterized protein YbjT (DUF2867 family)
MILVTGATGIIGRLLVRQLLEAKAEFAAFSRPNYFMQNLGRHAASARNIGS